MEKEFTNDSSLSLTDDQDLLGLPLLSKEVELAAERPSGLLSQPYGEISPMADDALNGPLPAHIVWASGINTSGMTESFEG